MFGVHWIELRCEDGYKRFQDVLKLLNVPNSDLTEDFDARIEAVLQDIYGE